MEKLDQGFKKNTQEIDKKLEDWEKIRKEYYKVINDPTYGEEAENMANMKLRK